MNQPVAVITGSSGGIGSACVRRFQAAGWFVVGIDRVPDSRPDEHIAADLAEVESIDAVTQRLDGRRVQALVNNAGVLGSSAIADLGVAEWDAVVNVNLRAAVLLARALLPLVPSGGSIVNVSSVHAIASRPSMSAYAAAKAGLVGWTQAAAVELGPSSIRVNAVVPGAIDTAMLAPGPDRSGALRRIASWTPLGRIGTPEEAAEVIFFLSDSASSFITGQTVVVDGGALARLSTE